MEHESDCLIDQPRASDIAGIKKSEIWRRIKAGSFPAPIRLGERCTRWSLREVSQWVEQRKAERAAA